MAVRYPPRGLGYYVRGQPQDDVRWALAAGASFIAFQSNDVRWLELHRPNGVGIMFYALPEAWKAGRWRETIRKLEALVERFDGVGYIADREDPNPELGDVLAMREALVRSAQRMVVVCTSFPTWRYAAELAHPDLHGSPQIYLHARPDGTPDRSDAAAVLVPRYMRKWQGMDWGSVIPSVSAGTQIGPTERTGAQQRAYLEAFGKPPAAIVWSQDLSPPKSAELLEAFRGWPPPPFCSPPPSGRRSSD